MKPNGNFAIGDTVKIICPGHRRDGRTGTLVYFGSFMGTWGVDINGDTYGFFPSELSKAAPEEP